MAKSSGEKVTKQMDTANAIAAEARLNFEMFAEMQKDERLEAQKMYHEQMDKQRKHYGKIIMGLIITLAVLIAGIVGCAAYILTNFDIATGTYQEMYIGGDGQSTIQDGIHINDE